MVNHLDKSDCDMVGICRSCRFHYQFPLFCRSPAILYANCCSKIRFCFISRRIFTVKYVSMKQINKRSIYLSIHVYWENLVFVF